MLKIGHGGARAYEPENTLQNFRKAINLGVDAVELARALFYVPISIHV